MLERKFLITEITEDFFRLNCISAGLILLILGFLSCGPGCVVDLEAGKVLSVFLGNEL